ncbi:MAG: T9SS type A sorting domain-containing protein [Saprospiraceae bacterium]|nr:T9SS type A sorting domain-containing protein [Saprospiraceae bacterium]
MTDFFRYSTPSVVLFFDDGSLMIPFQSAPHADPKAYTYILKTDTLGNQLWLKRMYRHVITEGPPKLRKLPDGNLVLITVVDTLMPPHFNPFVVFVTKIDTSGNKIWEVSYDWPGSYLLFGDIEVTAEGDILIGGTFADQANSAAWISKVSAEGEKLWEKTYKRDLPVQLNFVIYDIAECPDGGIIVSGLGQDPVEGATYTDGNAWVMKVDSNGCFYPDNCEEFTLITSVADIHEPEAPDIRLFPNPTPDAVFVALPEGLPFADLAVYDALGRLVLRRRMAHNESVHLPEKGLYYFAFFRDAVLLKSVKVLIT